VVIPELASSGVVNSVVPIGVVNPGVVPVGVVNPGVVPIGMANPGVVSSRVARSWALVCRAVYRVDVDSGGVACIDAVIPNGVVDSGVINFNDVTSDGAVISRVLA
jgi:hypothetical protein